MLKEEEEKERKYKKQNKRATNEKLKILSLNIENFSTTAFY